MAAPHAELQRGLHVLLGTNQGPLNAANIDIETQPSESPPFPGKAPENST